MTRLFHWLGIFIFAALVTHLSYVLFLPKYEAHALIREMRAVAGANTFTPITGSVLRRLVRHPLPDAAYGMCELELSEKTAVLLRGPDLRAMWALTVYSPRNDVIYAITDRHVPAGSMRVRFEYRPPASPGEVVLPRLADGTMVVPLRVKQALLVLEIYPRHPGQRPMMRALVEKLRCGERKPAPPAAAESSAQSATASQARRKRAVLLPRARPARP